MAKRIDLVVRLTRVYRKIKGRWLIEHEQVSVPVDLDTDKPISRQNRSLRRVRRTLVCSRKGLSVLPQGGEALGVHAGVAFRVLDIGMAEVGRQRQGIEPHIYEAITAAMS